MFHVKHFVIVRLGCGPQKGHAVSKGVLELQKGHAVSKKGGAGATKDGM